MRKPFDGNYIQTQGFGEHPENYTQYHINGHNGLDYAVPVGTQLLAPHGGKVIEATYDPSGYGYYVKIEDDTQGSVLAHMLRIDVQVGMHLNEGDKIGLSGNSGYVLPAPTPQNPTAGAHLHWGWYRKPRNRQNGFNGFEDQTQELNGSNSVSTYIFKYKKGDQIKPGVIIPVGPEPGKENITYGKISEIFPADIIGTRIVNGLPYYNIDQHFIGGGTGWVNAEIVDNAPDYTPTPSPARTYTEEEYSMLGTLLNEEVRKIREERDHAINDCNEQNKILIGFKSQGFNTVEDVTKLINQKDETLLGLQKQNREILNRNIDLAKMVEKKETEDSTAIDEGIKAAEEAKELREHTHQISKELETKPNISDILRSIWDLKDYAKKAIEQGKQEALKNQPVVPEEKVTNLGVDWLMNILGLGQGVKK